VDRATARRPLAPALVGLRRHPHPAAAVEDRRARRHPGRRTIEGDARRHAEELNDDPDESHRATVDAGGIRIIMDNDLRGTAATRLALAGCTEAEIAAITGHSLRDVRSILDLHYLHRDPGLAENAIAKLERRTNCSQLPSQLAEAVTTETSKSRGG
jgi:hypothetical protein